MVQTVEEVIDAVEILPRPGRAQKAAPNLPIRGLDLFEVLEGNDRGHHFIPSLDEDPFPGIGNPGHDLGEGILGFGDIDFLHRSTVRNAGIFNDF